MDEKEQIPWLMCRTNNDFKRDFIKVAKKEGFKTVNQAIQVILRDWVSKRRGPQEIINERLLEGEKKAHIAVFGEVQKDEQGNVKNVFNIMNNGI